MIKFVYFDVGGTVIKDFSATTKWKDLMQEFGLTNETWDKFYKDKLDLGERVEALSIPYDKLLAGFVNRFERNESIWPLIDEIKKYCKVGLLTNMYPGMLDQIKSRGLLPNIIWDEIVDSTIVKFKKPEKEIYKIAQQKTGVKPEEILFIDNTLENLEVPKNLGWQTFLYDSKNYEKSTEQLKTYFSQIGPF